ncbi:MAG: cupin domain-containing protein [Gemmatimonadaceae bacterium]
MNLSGRCLITIAASAALAVPGNGVFYLVPTILPRGARVTFVSGNPYLPEKCSVEFRMPDKYVLPPHTHPQVESVVLKSDTLRVGLGKKIDRARSVLLSAGDSVSTPAGVPHWSIAEGEVDIIVTYETGPMGIAYMSKRDEPGSHSFPGGY